MSEPKLISPLLDGFVMGDPISDHDGVRCFPAMRENSDDKYIVKIISVPASQKQLDALLLTGAYKDAGAAAEYFKALAEDTVKEARLLQQLAKLEGFLAYEGWQIVPMDSNELGYDVYLLGSYKRSLEKHLCRNTMSHLSAVNLGLDLCSALSLCRRAGFIYTALKPANIYISGQREYRIGDLGFSKLNAMKYTSLPGKYISRYTPPELHDPLATLNPTVDTYAVGMILYQIYNNGELPFAEKAPLKYLPSPVNADYEIAEIIQKACDPNPRKRYQNPAEMSQALVSYMQRNSINDVPIVPPSVDPIPVQKVETPAEVPASVGIESETDVPDVSVPQSEELQFMEQLVSDETAPGADETDDLVDAPMSDEVDQILAKAEELISHEPDIIPEAESVAEVTSEEASAPIEEPGEEAIPTAVIPEETVEEENAIAEPAIEVTADESSEASPAEEVDEDFGIDFTESVTIAEEEIIADLEFGLPIDPPVLSDDELSEIATKDSPAPRKKKRGWVTVVILLLILALLGGGAYYYYTNHYLLPISNMVIDGFEDSLTVKVTTDADESLLTVICTDTYGNKQAQPLQDGIVVFSGLNPDTMYKILVEAEGVHKLTGAFSGSYVTAVETRIVEFSAKAGKTDGSVVLNFTVDGPETQEWAIEYAAEGEEANSVTFSGHMVTINDLTVGKLYTFTLLPADDMYLTGNVTLEHTASQIVIAENLSVVSCIDGVLTAQWSAPEGATDENWTVRCYSDSGYDETITVTETTAQFQNISNEYAYTVEVSAAGMSQNVRAYVSADPSTITDVQVSHAVETGLTISWKSDSTPKGGWLVMYSVDGSDTTEMAACNGNSAVVRNVISNASYSFQIKAADGSTVFGGNYEFAGIEPIAFNQYGLSATYIQSSLCRTPDKENWTYEDVKDSDYTTSYAADEHASLVLYTYAQFYLKTENTDVMFVIRNADGKVIPTLTRTVIKVWRDLWPGTGKYCYLDIPVLPAADGKYTLEVYFNGETVLTKNFSIITANG